MRRHLIKTRPATWARWGFVEEERYYLSEIGRFSAHKAPYIQAMIRRRLSLNANRVRYGWPLYEYRQRVVAEYQRMGLREKGKRETYRHYFDSQFYNYLQAWREKILPDFPEWETPRAKKRRRVKGEAKPQANKRKMLNAKIDDLNKQIVRASGWADKAGMRRLEIERNKYQRQLDNLK